MKSNQLADSDVQVITGTWNKHVAQPAPSASWANNPDNEVAIYILSVKAGGSVELPRLPQREPDDVSHRRRNCNRRKSHKLKPTYGMELYADQPTIIKAGEDDVQVLILQGKPIGEPV